MFDHPHWIIVYGLSVFFSLLCALLNILFTALSVHTFLTNTRTYLFKAYLDLISFFFAVRQSSQNSRSYLHPPPGAPRHSSSMQTSSRSPGGLSPDSCWCRAAVCLGRGGQREGWGGKEVVGNCSNIFQSRWVWRHICFYWNSQQTSNKHVTNRISGCDDNNNNSFISIFQTQCGWKALTGIFPYRRVVVLSFFFGETDLLLWKGWCWCFFFCCRNSNSLCVTCQVHSVRYSFRLILWNEWPKQGTWNQPIKPLGVSLKSLIFIGIFNYRWLISWAYQTSG